MNDREKRQGASYHPAVGRLRHFAQFPAIGGPDEKIRHNIDKCRVYSFFPADSMALSQYF
jgi:hypothetical protein